MMHEKKEQTLILTPHVPAHPSKICPEKESTQ